MIVRSPTDTQMVSGYGYTRAIKDSWRLRQFIQERIEPVLDGGRSPLWMARTKSIQKVLLSTVRASYMTRRTLSSYYRDPVF